MNPNPLPENGLTCAQAAVILQIHPNTVRRKAALGELPVVRSATNRVHRFRPEDVETYRRRRGNPWPYQRRQVRFLSVPEEPK